MITGKKEDLDQYVSTHECPEHPDKALTVAWVKDHGYLIRCGADHYPEEITRVKSLTQAVKSGEVVHPAIEENVKKSMAKHAKEISSSEVYKSLGITPAVDLGTGALLDPKQVQLLVAYAKRYDLDLFLGHAVILYGKPYCTIDGYYYHARRTNVPYSIESRPLKVTEREEYMILEKSHAWLAKVTKTPSGSSWTGLGIVTEEELTATSPRDKTKLRSPVVAAHPWQLAQKRAEWQAMRRAFPLGSPDEEEGEEQ